MPFFMDINIYLTDYLKSIFNGYSISDFFSIFAVIFNNGQPNIDRSIQYKSPSCLCTLDLNECSNHEACTW